MHRCFSTSIVLVAELYFEHFCIASDIPRFANSSKFRTQFPHPLQVNKNYRPQWTNASFAAP